MIVNVLSLITRTPEISVAAPVSLSCTPMMSPRNTLALNASVRGLVARSNDHLTSPAVTDLPSWNLASGWMRKVAVMPSALMSQLSARSPTMARFLSMVISPP